MKLQAIITAAIAVAIVVSASPADAQRAKTLKGEALRQEVAGATVLLNTPLGDLPIKFAEDGTMTGKSKKLARFTGSVSDRGKWFVRKNKLCQEWRRWFNGDRKCLTLRKKGKTFFWRLDDGTKGTAKIARRTPRKPLDSSKRSALGAASIRRNARPAAARPRLRLRRRRTRSRRLRPSRVGLAAAERIDDLLSPRLLSPPRRIFRQ